jgi:Chaperone of endosialidase
MSTYTTSLGLELITPGSQAGLWGNTTNNTFTLVDQAITGVTPISFATSSGATYVLTDFNGAVDESRSAVLNITGSATGSNTVVVPNKQKTYLVRNNTGQDVIFRTASPSATYNVGAGYSILIFCDGNNNVFTGIASPSVGTLSVNGGGTGNTTFGTGGFIKSSGGTNALTASSTVNASSEMSGILPVTNGGTGLAAITAGAVLLGNGTGNVAALSGSSVGQVLTWNGSNWFSSTPSTSAVTSVNGQTGAVNLTYASVGAASATGIGASGTWPIAITGNAGTATSASTALSAANVTATGSNSITMTTNSAARMTINSSGRVGIGTTNPQRPLHIIGPSGSAGTLSTGSVQAGLWIENATNTSLSFIVPTGNAATITGLNPGASTAYAAYGMNDNGNNPFIYFGVGPGGAPERARINNSGNMLIGTTAEPASPGRLNVSNTPGLYCVRTMAADQGGSYFHVGFGIGNSVIGSVTSSTTTTSYNTSSDYRLKENIAPMQNALGTLSKLNPVTYTWKANGEAGQGFIAHELQAVVPDCVTGEKDEVDKDGNPIYQGMDTSHLVATLVKAIQELKAELDATKVEVAELKAAQ